MFDSIIDKVVVVSEKNEFMSYTHPARARKLLKNGKADVFSTDPFTIRLKGERGAKMQVRPTRNIINFTEYFREVRDVYVQNLTNTQVSIQFETSPGRFDSVLIPRTRKPFNLTQHIPFKAIERSTDIRKLVNRNPTGLRLMSEKEYRDYYEKLAEINETSLSEEIEKSDIMQSGLMNKTAFSKSEESEVKTIEDMRKERAEDPDEAVEEQIHPKVVGLCSQVGADIDDDYKLSASEFMDELEMLEDELKASDLEYVMSLGHYSIIKRWARNKFSQFTETEGMTKVKSSKKSKKSKKS